MKDFIKGFFAFFNAFGFIFSKRLILWYSIPVILYIIFVIGFSLSIYSLLFPYFESLLKTVFNIDINVQNLTGYDSLKSMSFIGLSFILSWAIKIFIWYFFSRIMKYIILIIISPALAYISEKTEAILTGKSYPFNFTILIKNTARGIIITVRNLLLEIILISLGFILSFFIPILAPAITLTLFIVNCYFMGFNMFDYISERKELTIRQSVLRMRKNRNMVFGLGLAYNLVSFVPLADWVIAPINGAVGAVLVDS